MNAHTSRKGKIPLQRCLGASVPVSREKSLLVDTGLTGNSKDLLFVPAAHRPCRDIVKLDVEILRCDTKEIPVDIRRGCR